MLINVSWCASNIDLNCRLNNGMRPLWSHSQPVARPVAVPQACHQHCTGCSIESRLAVKFEAVTLKHERSISLTCRLSLLAQHSCHTRQTVRYKCEMLTTKTMCSLLSGLRWPNS